jgi:HAE1 family hydrophobic/amphiphilic exporter-1
MEINQTVNALVGGTVVGKYSTGNYRNDIRVRLIANERNIPSDITHLGVRNNRGEIVPLKEVVEIRERPALQAIFHQDRERAISVFANPALSISQERAIEEVHNLALRLPDGYRMVVGGNARTFKDSFRGLAVVLTLGIIVSYMILAAQFNSFAHPLVVLAALPFSLSGAVGLLWLTNQSLNIFSMIGIVLLMGIVKKNSILLVDFSHQLMAGGLDPSAALLKACPIRLRPILMTSVSTLAAAIPPALALGPGSESRVPMAVSVLGGVTVSTIFTLIVVPAMYLIIQKPRQLLFARPR